MKKILKKIKAYKRIDLILLLFSQLLAWAFWGPMGLWLFSLLVILIEILRMLIRRRSIKRFRKDLETNLRSFGVNFDESYIDKKVAEYEEHIKKIL